MDKIFIFYGIDSSSSTASSASTSECGTLIDIPESLRSIIGNVTERLNLTDINAQLAGLNVTILRIENNQICVLEANVVPETLLDQLLTVVRDLLNQLGAQVPTDLVDAIQGVLENGIGLGRRRR